MVDDPAVTPAKPWFDGAAAEVVGYITNRGLDKVDVREAALRSIEAHRNAEKLLGGPADRLMRVPTDAADADGWGKVWTALGKPKEAAGYDLTAVKEAGDGFVNFVRDFAFKHNLSKTVGEELGKEFVKHQTAATTEDTNKQELAVAKERDDLKKEWGFNHTANMLTAKAAVEKLGIDPAAVAALEGKVGYKAVVTMFHKIGTAIGEDKFVTSQTTGQTMTPDGAVARIGELKSDKAWVDRYLAGGKKELEEMKSLTAISRAGR